MIESIMEMAVFKMVFFAVWMLMLVTLGALIFATRVLWLAIKKKGSVG